MLSHSFSVSPVTLNPALRNWKGEWVRRNDKAAFQMSAFISAWESCVALRPNSACLTVWSTTAEPPSTLCAQTNTLSTAWSSVNRPSTLCWWGMMMRWYSHERHGVPLYLSAYRGATTWKSKSCLANVYTVAFFLCCCLARAALVVLLKSVSVILKEAF